MTTTNLNKTLRARWYDVSPPVAAVVVVFALLLIGLLVGRIQSMPSVVLQPTPALPIIIIASPRMEPPRPTPAPPTPDQAVYAELAALRARVAELEAQQAVQPQPEVVYVQQPAAEAAPTPEQYQVTNEPPTMAPQTAAILDRGAWASSAATAQAGR